jgi:hypothetical protein
MIADRQENSLTALPFFSKRIVVTGLMVVGVSNVIVQKDQMVGGKVSLKINTRILISGLNLYIVKSDSPGTLPTIMTQCKADFLRISGKSVWIWRFDDSYTLASRGIFRRVAPS